MTYTPGLMDIAPPMVSPFTLGVGVAGLERIQSAPPSSSTWESGNAAVYFPVLVPVTCVVRRLWWANGATVSASYNVDVGVYADAGYKPGTRLVSSGSTAQGTASQVQFVNVTDTTLAPGRYWLAIACSSVVATFFRVVAAASQDAALRMEETSAVPLPATATPVESTGLSIYLFGFATTASP